MTALTADKHALHKETKTLKIGVKASNLIYKSAIVMVIKGTGYAIPGANTQNGIVMGFADDQVDNSSGSDGDLKVKVIRDQALELVISGVTVADIGKDVYVVDDQTGQLTPNSSGVKCGKVSGVIDTNIAYVDMSDILGMLPSTESVYGIKVYDVRAADFAALAISETAGDFYLSLSSDVMTILGEISNNETEVSVGYFQYVLPPEYIPGSPVKIRVKHQTTGAGTAVVSTIDFTCKEQDGEGAVGADLVTTAAATIVKDTWTTTDFTVTPTNLVPGDILSIKMTTSVAETATANIQAELDGLAIVLDRT